LKKLTFLLFALFALLSHHTTLADNNVRALEEDEGYAIIAIYSSGYAEKIQLDGEGFGNSHDFGPLVNSQYLKPYPLKAGTYKWDRVIEKFGQGGRIEFDFDKLDLTFTIEPGKVNYVGLLMFESNGSTFKARILNRTSIILTIFKQDFPEFLKQYDVVNGIYPSDPYIPHFLSE